MSFGALVKRALGRVAPHAVLVKGRPASTPRVALTFDDGPHPENTGRILDMLDAGGARATFFLQGENVERHPALARAIVARGHQVGNHGHSHLDAKRTRSGLYVADVERARAALQDATGAPIDSIFRPPHGSVTGATFLALARRGYRFVFWSVDSRDSFIRAPGDLVRHVEGLSVSDGDIMLFHDDYGHTAEALPAVLALLRARALGTVTIGAL